MIMNATNEQQKFDLLYVTKTTRGCLRHEYYQVVKVLWHKAASPPHMDGSVVFARLCQCAPHLVHTNWHPQHTSAAPCWVALSISTAGYARACPEAVRRPLFLSKLHFHVWRSGPHIIHVLSRPPESISQTTSRSVQPVLHSLRQRVPTLTMGRPFSPLKIALSHGGSGPHLIMVR